MTVAGRPAPAPAWTARALSAASGASALGCQMAWTQQAGILLGHEAAAVLAVVTAFMAGLALGALGFGARVARGAHPLRTYVICELLIGGWAALSPALVDAAAPTLLQAIGPQASPGLQWAWGFAALTLLWLPATAAMGVALPAMDRLLGADGRQVAGLYAANTAGALAGVVLSVAWLMPEVGLRQTARLCGLLNLACALLAVWRAAQWPGIAAAARILPAARGGAGPAAAAVTLATSTATATAAAASAAAVASAPPCSRTRRQLPGLLALSGLLGIGVEVLAVRVLSRVAENTLYTWAALLACYLMGTAAGAALWQRQAGRRDGTLRAGPWLLTAAGVLACGAVLAHADAWQAAALAWLQARGAEPLAAALAAETWPALLAFTPATAAMGALFSHLAGCAQRQGLSLGQVFGCNTLGAALAPPLLGLWALPVFGSGRVGAALCLAYLAVAAALVATGVAARGDRPVSASGSASASGRGGASAGWAGGLAGGVLVGGVLATAALTLGLVWPQWPRDAAVAEATDTGSDTGIETPTRTAGAPGAATDTRTQAEAAVAAEPPTDDRPQLLWRREGPLGEVRVLEDGQGVRTLQINRRAQEGDNVSRHVDGRQAALPLLLHAAPRRVLMVGLGTGVTARAAAADPSVRVEVVELLPEVAAAAPLFARPDEQAAGARLQLHLADARRLLRADDGTRWDLVIGDNVHPGRSGTAALHTVEQFRAVRARLAPGGLYCQWLPLHQLDAASLAGIVQAWLAVFPRGAAVLASHSLDTPVLGLLGRVDAHGADAAPLPSWAVLQRRVDEARAWAPSGRPAEVAGLGSAWDVAGAVVADAPALRALAGDAPAGTDDRPLLAWQALRVTYAPAEPPRARLAAWLQAWAGWRESAGADRLTALFGTAPAAVAPTMAGAGAAAWGNDIGAAVPPAVGTALQAWWAVRDDYLALGLRVRPSGDVRAMLAQVQVPMLALLQRSPGFGPARAALLRMADALAPQDAPAAAALRAAVAATGPSP